MTWARRTTFWRYNLFLEVVSLALASAILFAGIWFTLNRINQDYLDLRLADAARVHVFLESQLDEARAGLSMFADLPATQRSPQVMKLFTAFSDIYCLDRALRVVQIHKAVPNSKVFTGFSLSGGKLASYLQSVGESTDVSEIMRGYEDDAPSVYIGIHRGDAFCMGRLNLDYVRKFLIQFSQFSGAPLMLTASDGFVMLSGDPALQLPAIDLKRWSGAPSASRTLTAGNRRWIPLIAQTGAIGARIVMLVPTAFLDTQRNTLLAFVIAFMSGWFILVLLKNRRLNRLVMQPLHAFAGKLRDLEQDQLPPAAAEADQRFAELAEIHTRFRAMAEAIQQREQALRDSEKRYRIITESMKDVVWVFDMETRHFLYLSPSIEELVGVTSQDYLAAPLGAFLTPEVTDQLQSLWGRRAVALLSGQTKSGQFYIDEVLHPHHDGSMVWTEVVSTYWVNEESGHVEVRGVSRDIRERKQAQEALLIAKQQAEEASKAKSTFLSNMSHEIRTPLNAILGFAQVLIRDPHLTAPQRDSLTTIQRSGEHLLALINDILDMAKIEAGRMSVQVVPFDLIQLLSETESLFQQRARDRGLNLTFAISSIPRGVIGDAQKLRQVLINLVGNAVKFTPAGGIILKVEPAGAEQFRFSVSDTGVGIAPAEMMRLFEPFSQTASGRELQGGTGLGLALSYQFVRLMGGRLSAQSSLGQGSCFAFTLPLPAVNGMATMTDEASPTVLALEPGQPVCRVLIVDDLPDNRAPLRALLESLNPRPPVLEFREAADGQEALAAWEVWQPHLIFMDMRMPVLSGDAATRRIKARMAVRPAAVRSVIVALTAGAFDENREQVLASGCDAFTRKPFQAGELISIVERLAGLRFLRTVNPPPPRPLSPAEVIQRLSATPAGWRDEFEDAVVLGDFGRMEALLERLRGDDAILHKTLARWAYDYDLEALAALFSPG